jgi:spermidine/putrescine transport system permease protein
MCIGAALAAKHRFAAIKSGHDSEGWRHGRVHRSGMSMTTGLNLLGRAFLALVLLFLYAPLVVMVVMAFNASPLYRIPIEWSGVWFVRLLDNDRLLEAARNSVLLAAANTLVATALGTMAALAFARYRFRGRTLLQLLLFPPITIPWLIIGTAMLVFFFWTGIGRGLHAMLLGHVALSLPYVIVVVGARLRAHGTALEEAAATLGAGPWQTFRRVTLPGIAPGIVAAALFAFAVSFDQFVISYFLAAPGVTTLPVEIYTAIRKGFTPEINAISSLIIVVSFGLLMLVARFYRFGGER